MQSDCFGPRYVTKLNELAAMIQSDWQKHWVLEAAIVYQLYYMWSDKCTIDSTIKDIYDFCWDNDCTYRSLWANSKGNALYMSKAVIEAAIVWVQAESDHGQLSMQTG